MMTNNQATAATMRHVLLGKRFRSLPGPITLLLSPTLDAARQACAQWRCIFRSLSRSVCSPAWPGLVE